MANKLRLKVQFEKTTWSCCMFVHLGQHSVALLWKRHKNTLLWLQWRFWNVKMSMERLSGNSATFFYSRRLPLVRCHRFLCYFWLLCLNCFRSSPSVCLSFSYIHVMWLRRGWKKKYAFFSGQPQCQMPLACSIWLKSDMLFNAETEVSRQLIDNSPLDFHTQRDTVTHHSS